MSSHSISADIAKARHPEIYDELVKKIKASKSKLPLEPDEGKWSWSYQLAESTEALSIHDVFAQMSSPPPPASPVLEGHVSGRQLLKNKKDSYHIGLEVRTGRRSAYEALDNQKLLDGPDSSMPQEALGVFPRPTGASAWVWNEPGPGLAAYREQVILSAVQTQKGIAIKTQSPDQEIHLYLIDDTTKKGKEVLDWDGVFSRQEARDLDKTLASGCPYGAMVLLNEAALSLMFANKEGILILDARSPSISELLGALQGPGFMAFGQPPSDNPVPTPGEGPWISFDGVVSSSYNAPTMPHRSTLRP